LRALAKAYRRDPFAFFHVSSKDPLVQQLREWIGRSAEPQIATDKTHVMIFKMSGKVPRFAQIENILDNTILTLFIGTNRLNIEILELISM
jgi:hypothetical protein